MQLKLLLLVAFLGFAAAERRAYNGYVVYTVTPKNIGQMKVLMNYHNTAGFDFWTAPKEIGVPMTIMVAPEVLVNFNTAMKMYRIPNEVLIANVEDTIVAEDEALLKSTRALQGAVSFDKFLTYEEIVSYLNTLAQDYKDIVSVSSIGKTVNNRDIPVIKISTGGSNKPAILVDAGIHAREWIAPPVALYIINQLVENSTNSKLIANVDWYVIPVLNPDGYAYTHSNERLWRKNRKAGSFCYGVDLNRNFDFHWMENGASSNECSETFAGKSGFSELESQALRDFVLANADSIKLYLTFHSYGQYLLYPWGWTSSLPDNWKTLDNLAQNVNAAIKAVAGTTYEIGSSTNVLYAAAGGSDDWTKGVGGVELAYTIELPGGGSAGFNPPASSIKPIVQETWQGILVYQRYVEENLA